MKSKASIFLVGTVLVAALGWGGYQGLDRRYDALTKAAEAELDHGNVPVAARLAAAAMQGREWPVLIFDNSRAEGLLLEAMLNGMVPLTQTATRQLPDFETHNCVRPQNAVIAPDGSRLAIIHDEGPLDWTIEIFEPSSGRKLGAFPMSGYSQDALIGVTGFSPDLTTTIDPRDDGVTFRDTATGKAVLADFKAPEGFYRWTISDDRHFVTATNNTLFRVWDLSRKPARVTDFSNSDFDYARGYALSPDGKSVITGDAPGTLTELSSRKARLTLGSRKAVFSQDGRYLLASAVPDGATGTATGERGTRVWDSQTGKSVGSVITIDFVQSATTQFDGRLLAVSGVSGITQFLDLKTGRLVGKSSGMATARDAGMGWQGLRAYSIDEGHTLHIYALDPTLAMSGKALVAQACGRWGAKGRMTLTPAEIRTAHAVAAFDPCGG